MNIRSILFFDVSKSPPEPIDGKEYTVSEGQYVPAFLKGDVISFAKAGSDDVTRYSITNRELQEIDGDEPGQFALLYSLRPVPKVSR